MRQQLLSFDAFSICDFIFILNFILSSWLPGKLLLFYISIHLICGILFSEPIQYKVPLKSCQNSVIDHNLVTIWLGLEWPEKCGDDPSLVIHVANKRKEKYFFFLSF